MGFNLAFDLEQVDGRELNKYVERMTSAKFLSISLDIGCALEYLHSQDPPIVPGDLKPNNMMIQHVQEKARAHLRLRQHRQPV